MSILYSYLYRNNEKKGEKTDTKQYVIFHINHLMSFLKISAYKFDDQSLNYLKDY